MYTNIYATICAIENHSVSVLAAVDQSQLKETLSNRIYEVRGMLELARRLGSNQPLVRMLKNHIEWLEIKLAGL